MAKVQRVGSLKIAKCRISQHSLRKSMNGNETIIIFLAIIVVPFCIWVLFKMPNGSRCGSCNLPLNMYRQKTYHSVIGDKNIEVCEKCYKNRPLSALNETKSKPNRPVKISKQTSSISNVVEEIKIKPVTQRKPQQDNPVSTVGENISIYDVLADIKENNCVWLDTETTGLSSSDEIVEISICTRNKQVLFDSIIRARVNCSEQARAVHGISDEQIANGMPVESVILALTELLDGKTIISFNADFDCKMLSQTFGINVKKRFCVMKWSQSVLEYERWPSLEKVCERLNIIQPETHRSLADTITTIDVFDKLVDLTSNHKSLLRDFALIDLSKIELLEDEETLFLTPNSDIFAFDWLIDRYGNEIIAIRSKALKRLLKKEGARVFVKKRRKGKTLKISYLDAPNLNLPVSNEQLNYRLGALKLKKTNPNKYLHLSARVDTSVIERVEETVLNGTYYLPSIAVNETLYESLDNLPIFHNHDRDSIAFKIKTPKSTLKRLFALGLQGYSSIIKAAEREGKVHITAYHLLDAQNITTLGEWELDGEKSWSGDY